MKELKLDIYEIEGIYWSSDGILGDKAKDNDRIYRNKQINNFLDFDFYKLVEGNLR